MGQAHNLTKPNQIKDQQRHCVKVISPFKRNEAESKEKLAVWDRMLELTITSPYVHRVDSNTFTCVMGNPMPESTLTLRQSRLYPPVRDFGFGLSWPSISIIALREYPFYAAWDLAVSNLVKAKKTLHSQAQMYTRIHTPRRTQKEHSDVCSNSETSISLSVLSSQCRTRLIVSPPWVKSEKSKVLSHSYLSGGVSHVFQDNKTSSKYKDLCVIHPFRQNFLFKLNFVR